MPIARITGQGLAAIALSVALLWACFIGERLMVRDANTQCAQVMRELRQMQRNAERGQRDRRAQPVSTPGPRVRHAARATMG
jgi:hypothetical protein